MSSPTLETTPFYAQLQREYKALQNLLAESGYQPSVRDLDLPIAFAHSLRREDDIVHVAELGKHGYRIARGINLPHGQNTDRPSEAGIYLTFESVESPVPPYGDGARLFKLLGGHPWRINFWGAATPVKDLCGIRREVLNLKGELREGLYLVESELVPEIVRRWARHYMIGK